MTKHGGLACPFCGSRLVPSLSGPRCPRFGSCGRGGVEETADMLRGTPRDPERITSA